jgi:hypothetical protein
MINNSIEESLLEIGRIIKVFDKKNILVIECYNSFKKEDFLIFTDIDKNLCYIYKVNSIQIDNKDISLFNQGDVVGILIDKKKLIQIKDFYKLDFYKLNNKLNKSNLSNIFDKSIFIKDIKFLENYKVYKIK